MEFSNLQNIFIIRKTCLEIFWPHFEKQDGCHRRFSTFSKAFYWPSRGKGIIGRDLKFAGYVLQNKILTGYIFGLILKNKLALRAVFTM